MEIGDNNNDNGNVKYNKFLWIFDLKFSVMQCLPEQVQNIQ